MFFRKSTVGAAVVERAVSDEPIIENPIEEALQYSKATEFTESRASRKACVVERVDALVKLRDTLLPLERVAQQSIVAEISSLSKELNDLRAEEKFAGRYPRIYLDQPLRWRNRQKMPRLAVFSLHRPEMSFRASFDWDYVNQNWQKDSNLYFPCLPALLLNCYDDIRKLMFEKVKAMHTENHLRATTVFRGIIPEAIRDKINQARQDFGDADHNNKVFIISEVKEWRFDEIVPINIDPLIVGICGSTTWLIDSFDVTPLENVVRSEFTTSPEAAIRSFELPDF